MRIEVDPAAYGDHDTIVTLRFPRTTAVQTAELVVHLAKDASAESVTIDTSGVGGAIADMISRGLPGGIPVVEIRKESSGLQPASGPPLLASMRKLEDV